MTYLRYHESDHHQMEFGIAGMNSISDVFIVIFIWATGIVHILLQLDSLLKYKKYLQIVKLLETICYGIKISKKSLVYEFTYLFFLMVSSLHMYSFTKSQGLQGLLYIRIFFSEISCRMKILQYSIWVEIIDSCLSKALSRLSALKYIGINHSKEAKKEFLDTQKYLRKVNEFEDMIFQYLGFSIVISFVFEAYTFILCMYISTLFSSGLEIQFQISELLY